MINPNGTPRSHKTKPLAINSSFKLKSNFELERSYAANSDSPLATQCMCHHHLTNWIEKHLEFLRCCVDLICRQIRTRIVRRLLSIFFPRAREIRYYSKRGF